MKKKETYQAKTLEEKFKNSEFNFGRLPKYLR